MKKAFTVRLLACIALALPVVALAQIKIGVTISETGPQASLGIPEKNTVAMLPREIGGKKVEYIVLDDASDTTQTVTNTRKLISEEKVDAIIGSTTTPNTLAMLDVVAEGHTPTISLASSSRLVDPMDAKRAWMFKSAHSDSMIASAVLAHMVDKGVKNIAFIGFNNALGESFWQEISKFAELRQVKVVASERFSPSDNSVTAQVLKVMAAKPDAVVIGASGTPAALPARALKERGYKGLVYFNHGVSNSDFLKLCGKDCEGAYVATAPVIVAHQLPADHPARKLASEFADKYEAKYGKDSVSIFAAYTWDAGLWLGKAIPEALKHGQPGTPAFRSALRDALEGLHNLPTATGITNMSAQDHAGHDQRSRVIVQIQQGGWHYAGQ